MILILGGDLIGVWGVLLIGRLSEIGGIRYRGIPNFQFTFIIYILFLLFIGSHLSP